MLGGLHEEPPLLPDPARVTVIPARSRRQAMDWSLVLVSQGIETTIQRVDEVGGWRLLVPAHDGQNALQALRQYRAENRDWSWTRPLPWPDARFDWNALFWAALLVVVHWWSDAQPTVGTAGVLDANAVFAGQWWRVFTAIMLHADIGHLTGNLSIGVVLLGLAMARYGSGLGLLAAYLTGAAGNAVSLFVHGHNFEGLGASGMVMGALGLLSAQTLRWRESRQLPWKHRLVGLAAGVMLFVLYGLAPGTDIAAHFGGFASGVVLGMVLAFVPVSFLQRPRNNVICGGLLALLIVVTWGLALGAGK